MAAPRNREHIFVKKPAAAEPYRVHPRAIRPAGPPEPASRPAHGAALKTAFLDAVAEAKRRRDSAAIEIPNVVPGLYVQFESQPDVPLALASLEDATKKIELVAVTRVETDEPVPRTIERATVFVPEGKVKHFISRFESYAKATPKAKGERRHEAMLDPVAQLRLATLQGLWTDSAETYPPEGESIWWEVWLRRIDGRELERLMEFAVLKNIDVGARRLQFDDRIVTLVRATAAQLSASVDVLNDIAEVRRAKETPTVFANMSGEEQAEWVEELVARIRQAPGDAPAVCVLDTGVNRGHPLLQSSLDESDCHTCDPAWGSDDREGHGTMMAGLALVGDLTPVLAGAHPVNLRHVLESVKILPPHGSNPPELYGTRTAEATARAELQAPQRRRSFSMAISATDQRDRGQPTSWSGAVDALAAGRAFDQTSQGLVYLDEEAEPLRRLFIVSAGNIEADDLHVDHLDRSDVVPIHDPGQAWNALTVGAFTEKGEIRDPSWSSWQPVALPGDLSPWSSSGVSFADAWPIKPDVVMEGGNVVKNSSGEIDFPCADLCLLSTHFKPAEKSFVLTWATSAATAQAARLAGVISAVYPSAWPETVRALIVHSAEWTRAMHARFHGASRKRDRAKLVKRYGFGVPHLERAIRSANDSLTLIVQDTIHPFAEGKMREMHLFELPWPKEVLQGLGETPVRMRVTLSYFVEPNPARRGWKKRYQYASHGLRFDVKGRTQSVDEFRKRLNESALAEDEAKPSNPNAASDWYLGDHARNHGSIHSDILSGFAADIAERGVIGVVPVSGWWKEQPKRDRSGKGARYALIVSLETPGVDADIWTPVAEQVDVAVSIAQEINV